MEEAEIGEVGVEKVNEGAHEKAHEDHQRTPWLRWLALSTAFFAVTAAVASLISGQYANEALIKQSQATDQWSYYQAKGNKSVTRSAEANILAALHAPDAQVAAAREEANRYKEEQEKIQESAKELELESRRELAHHERFAYIVTSLQVAIGLSAVAALSESFAIWIVAVLGGAAGIVLFVVSLLLTH